MTNAANKTAKKMRFENGATHTIGAQSAKTATVTRPKKRLDIYARICYYKNMTEHFQMENLKKLHKAQDTIIALRCKMAGLKGKCMAVIEWPDMYTPEEVKWAKEMEAEIDEMLSPNQLKQLLA